MLQLGDISVDVVFKDIKNVHLSVYPPTGRVRISAPARMSLETVRVFAISKLGWIKKQQKKLLSQERESPREYLERESHYLWGKRYLLHICEDESPAGVEIDHSKLILKIPGNADVESKQRHIDNWYRMEMKQAVPPLVAKWERQLDLQVNKVFIQKMKTRWGSSNPQARTIRLNLELARKVSQCLDYVIFHEILHFLVPDHGDNFVSLMNHHMPNWRYVRQKLNEAPLAHADWLY